MGELIAGLIENRPPLKGLITDLDDTLWSGIVGEDGVDGISWNLDDHSQMHGVYQQFLTSMAAAGVLIGVASKNDAGLAGASLRASGFASVKRGRLSVWKPHWDRKSESIRRIVNTWNIGADAAVFIDDSPAEVAEVQAAFPELTCRVFLKNDPTAIWTLLHELRDLFGKPAVTQEDLLRLRSIRNAAVWRNEGGAPQTPPDEFLRSAEARICFEGAVVPAISDPLNLC